MRPISMASTSMLSPCSTGSACRPILTFATICPGPIPRSSICSNGRAIPTTATKLSEKIAAVTPWKKENIDKLIAPEHFDLNRPEAFRNEINLVKLRQATTVADKIAVDIDRLFEWAKPGSKFWVCHQIAEDIRKAIRARYDEDVWEQVVKPLERPASRTSEAGAHRLSARATGPDRLGRHGRR